MRAPHGQIITGSPIGGFKKRTFAVCSLQPVPAPPMMPAMDCGPASSEITIMSGARGPWPLFVQRFDPLSPFGEMYPQAAFHLVGIEDV